MTKDRDKQLPILNSNSDLNLNFFPVIPFCLALALSLALSAPYSSRRDFTAQSLKRARGLPPYAAGAFVAPTGEYLIARLVFGASV